MLKLLRSIGSGVKIFLGILGLLFVVLMHWQFLNFFNDSGGFDMSGGAAAVLIILGLPWLMGMLWAIGKVVDAVLTDRQLSREAEAEQEEQLESRAQEYALAYQAEKAMAARYWAETTKDKLERYGRINYEDLLAREKEINEQVEGRFADSEKVAWFTHLAQQEGFDVNLIFDYWRVPQIELMGAKSYMSVDGRRLDKLKDEELAQSIFQLREEQRRRQAKAEEEEDT